MNNELYIIQAGKKRIASMNPTYTQATCFVDYKKIGNMDIKDNEKPVTFVEYRTYSCFKFLDTSKEVTGQILPRSD